MTDGRTIKDKSHVNCCNIITTYSEACYVQVGSTSPIISSSKIPPAQTHVNKEQQQHGKKAVQWTKQGCRGGGRQSNTGERNVNSGLQAQMEKDDGGSRSQSQREESGL